MEDNPLQPAYARQLDQNDPLASFRERFVHAEPHLIYLDGNSLGRLPVTAAANLRRRIEIEWGARLIRGWNEGWMALSARIGQKIAGLIDAQPEEVIMADSTSVNLYKLALSAVLSQPDRATIVTDDLNFPSDIYILQSVARLTDKKLVIIPSDDGIHGPVDRLAAAVNDQTALLALSHTAFKSGFTYDMITLTRLAHKVGARMLWDMSHSVGALPGQLNTAGADLAVGCTYKYLNGGPGAPAWLYVRRDRQSELQNPLSGWMGQQDIFGFSLAYDPAPGLRRFLTGTPPILSLAAVEPGVDLLLEAGIDAVRQKSMRQTAYVYTLWEKLLRPLGFEWGSPTKANLRGSHVALGHDEGWRIDQALIDVGGVLPDFRQPRFIRLGFAPLYNSFEELYIAVDRLRTIVTERIYMAYDQNRHPVT